MRKLQLANPEVLPAEETTTVAPPRQWRSLRDLEDPESVVSDDEFNPEAVEALDWDEEKLGVKRREMLKLMGASFALMGGGAACIRRPEEHIVPFTKQPENMIPGVSDWYASALPTPWGAQGILVESHDGRPTKIEGNPDHPASGGKADVHAHASILQLYDPDRTGAKDKDLWSRWDTGFKGVQKKLTPSSDGTGFAILLDTAEGPTLDRVLGGLKAKMPATRVYKYDPLTPDNHILGAEMVYGPGARVHHDLSKADVILSIDADFLTTGPEHLKHAAGFAAGRGFDKIKSAADADKMNRLYAVESTFTATGTNADHRLRVASGEMIELLKAIGAELLGKHGLSLPAAMGDAGGLGGALTTSFKASNAKFVPAVAKDLANHRKRAVIVVGEQQPAAAHALANALNAALGGLEGPVSLSRRFPAKHAAAAEAVEGEDGEAPAGPSLAAHVSSHASLTALLADINSGKVKTLLILGPNPAATAPKAMKVAEAFAKLSYSVHVGLYDDETAATAKMHLPLAHPLETWGDALAWDGTLTVQQPLIQPLHNGRSAIEVLAQLSGAAETDGRSLVRGTLAAAPGKHKVSETKWRKILHDGITGRPHRERMGVDEAVGIDGATARVASAVSKLKGGTAGIELVVAPCPKVLDGRHGNLSWCQELPEPMSKLTWDNALMVGVALANKLGIKSTNKSNKYVADLVSVSTAAGSIEIPAFVQPGLAPNTALVHLGYGRTRGGYVANGVGSDATALLPADGSTFVQNAKIATTGKTYDLAATQDHFSMKGTGFFDVLETPTAVQDRKQLDGTGNRPHAQTLTVKEYRQDPYKAHNRNMPGNLVELKRLSKAGQEKKHKGGHDFHPTAQDLDRPSRPTRGLQMANMDVTKEAWDYPEDRQAWGMTIDLGACIGCNACTIACQSENNIPSVGKESVFFGREMHWIRVDRYFEGDVDEPNGITQPVPCMHCENAPCEPVCPFAATVHDEEGINSMVYNRCAGTRYCLNNCPYKVRRYNYFDYTKTAHLYVEKVEEERHELLEMARNPNVTVRFRGVMEKCTFCTQRIQAEKFKYKRAGKDSNNMADGAVTPACAQTCPTSAITFGNVNDPKSEVSKRKVADRQYEVLSELNNRPRTTYLAKLRNPNPELV
jgi:molybdopterin-containing oxidoreductase family iron-sulfur binding subunit